MIDTMMGAYMKGLRFISVVKKQGWGKVEELYSRPPVSSAQILHPEKWLRDEKPYSIEFPETEGEAVPEHGQLTAIRLLDLESKVLYPASSVQEIASSSTNKDAANDWGDASCPGPPDPNVFKPHGIDVGLAADGREALAVVNHGGRDAVEASSR